MTAAQDRQAVAAIRASAADLGSWLAEWNARNEAHPSPLAIISGKAALKALDTIVGEAHGIRVRLVPALQQAIAQAGRTR